MSEKSRGREDGVQRDGDSLSGSKALMYSVLSGSDSVGV